MKTPFATKKYWQPLSDSRPEQLFHSPLESENGSWDGNPGDEMNRRRFLSFMTASISLAGLASCRRPVEHIVPYVHAPEEIIPGIPIQYATAMPFDLDSYGILATSHEGRPTKVDGNPRHPSIAGSSNVYLQSSILGLYDPDRSQFVRHNGLKKDWPQFVSFWRERLTHFQSTQGQGLAFLCDQVASPTRFRLMQQMQSLFPKAIIYSYNPLSVDNILGGAGEEVAPEYVKPIYHFEKAAVILTCDADVLGTEPNAIYHAGGFAKSRTPDQAADCNRLYVIEPGYTVTGQMADHRIRLSSSRIEAFLFALAAELHSQGLEIEKFPAEIPDSVKSEWLKAIAQDLLQNRGKSLIVPGRRQPTKVHQLSALLNSLLNNIGRTVEYHPLQDCLPTRHALLKLQQAIKTDKLDTVVLLNVNPVYNHAADLDVAKLCRTRHVIHFSSYQDESAQTAEWHLPADHYLEYWGDVRDWNGSAALIQPLIRPLYDTRSDIELIHLLMTGSELAGYQLVRDTWRSLLTTDDFEKAWKHTLYEGFLSEPGKKPFVADLSALGKAVSTSAAVTKATDSKKYEFVFQPSFSLFDGRFSNNAWLQELPDPITKIAWDSVAVISRVAALEMQINNGDVIELNRNGITISLPVWVLPGQADRTITLTMGYGRLAAGLIGSNVGANVFKLRSTNQEYITYDIEISKTEKKYRPANAQEYGYTQGRPLIREATLQEYKKNPTLVQEMVEHPPYKSLWKEHEYLTGYQWGMVIDLNLCNGCSACVIACQCENNIPIVGKEQVANGREMHWIRLDRYFSGEHDEAEMVHQPVACQHCENAPCEQVCPVAATVHDQEGLNVMAYNRCVGTRYCSNNCPYSSSL